eukprot:gnl/TRDRNA2_/TRDRNA2_189643_c0_seq1.p1 gnl/TRDRNA2_/TRDRNA2_189643_c0~~gnl/TRDRNA2_/TRDRNA2_189643_c0_seq1.p1  ORF type:complete len:347 (+),score=66.81 gnl/TRDRNA2_/TRDRNA2_189643_c0_seq1:147-1187(+)
MSSKAKPPTKINGGKYELTKKLGAGCFGEVFRGVDTDSKEEVAVKCEDATAQTPQLEHEAHLLNYLKTPVQQQGFVDCLYFGREGSFNVLVMELLSKSLEDRVQGCNGKFNVKTTALIGEQIMHRIEFLHSKGYVHRDIKPENFMFGVKGKAHHIYLIDFGLSKKYFDKVHCPLKSKLNLTGTARYASINAHRGLEQSRRDDLEAIGHMLLYFLRSALPWSGLEAKTKQEKYRKIKEKKEEVPLAELCTGFPGEFQQYLEYARHLQFKDKPDYQFLRGLFQAVRQREGNPKDHEYEWNDGKQMDNLVAVKVEGQVTQPDDVDTSKKAGKSGGGPCFCCGGKSAVKD